MSTAKIKPRPMLTHLGIHVSDLEPMVGFYQRVLGLTITDRGRGLNLPEDMVFLSSSPDIHHQLLLCTGRKSAIEHNHINQISFRVKSLEEMQEIARRLASEDVSLMMQLDHGNAWSIYFKDLENNTVELYAESPWYVPQPYGRKFDILDPAEETRAATRKFAEEQEGFKPCEDWAKEMKEEMGVDS